MATPAIQVALLDKLRLAGTGYIPSAPDLSAVTTVADSPPRRTSALLDWVIETASDVEMDAAIAAMS